VIIGAFPKPPEGGRGKKPINLNGRRMSSKTIPGNRQSFYEDCHTLNDRFRGTPSSTRKGCLSKGYGLPARTLRRVGTTHNSIPNTGKIFLTMEDFRCSIFLLIYRIKGFFKDLEANPKDSGDEYRRLLDKPLDYPSGPWMAGLFLVRIWNAGRLTASFAGTQRKALQHWKRRKDIWKEKRGELSDYQPLDSRTTLKA
jgi:hypothetical protein